MRTFAEIKRELALQKFSDSPTGTLYFIPYSEGSRRIIVRHFDKILPPTMVQPFVEIVHAAAVWIEVRAELRELVRVEQPIEVGTDFVARKHHSYYTATVSYFESDDPPEPPEELEQMRSAFQRAVGGWTGILDTVVERVLVKSLLEPTGKTYFGDSNFSQEKGQFIVVEPKIAREDLESWIEKFHPNLAGDHL